MSRTLLEEDHDAVGALLEELRAALRAGLDVSAAYGLLDIVWARLAVHIRAEHLRLFPALLEAPRGLFDGQGGAPHQAEVEAAIEHLREDHDFFMRELAAAVNALRGLLTGTEGRDVRAELEEVRRGVERVAARLLKHNALEEEQVYRWAELLPGAQAQAQLAADLRRELTNLPPRFNDEN